MAGDSSIDDKFEPPESWMVESRKRAGAIDRYLDMIPARFILSSEAVQKHKPRSSLDPAQCKPTSQLVMEVVMAQAAAEAHPSAGSSSPSGKKAKNKSKASAQKEPGEYEGASSRGELRGLLEKRISDLKEERRKKQSAADKEKHKKALAERGQNIAAKATAPTPPAKRQSSEAVSGDDVEAGKLSFEPRLGELPYDVQVNRKGTKVKQLRANLRKEEAKKRKIDEAKGPEERDALRNEYALNAAMRRARGEKVHDDVSRLRKQQKQLELKKVKGKEKWDSRIEKTRKEAEAGQQRKKDNLKARREKKKKGGKGRAGFEGKKTDHLNKEE